MITHRSYNLVIMMIVKNAKSDYGIYKVEILIKKLLKLFCVFLN